MSSTELQIRGSEGEGCHQSPGARVTWQELEPRRASLAGDDVTEDAKPAARDTFQGGGS